VSWSVRRISHCALMGGVPTLTAGGHGGIVMLPYRRMKSIGLRQVRVRRGTSRTRRTSEEQETSSSRRRHVNNINHNTSSIAVTTR
jgi:RNA polymerase-interacting CarD/CdnL/TRCF family regulator